MREPFLKKLDLGPIVCDGAMGTMLYAKGVPYSHSFEDLNLSRPQLVKEVHLAYVKAGAEVLETNTFGGNRFRLAQFDLAEKVREINLAGARLAREVAGDELYVAGSVGPLGVPIEPLGPTSLEDAREAFREQIAALAEGGADVIIVETMMDIREARQALAAAREICKLPVIVQMTVAEDGNTPEGNSPEDFTRQLDAWGADVIGINCSVGPAIVLDALERMAAVTAKKLSAQPNAGLPQTIGGRTIYVCSPEYMAGYARRFIEAGARLVGGCCGTTPDHIRAIKAAARSLRLKTAKISAEGPAPPATAFPPKPAEARSGLGAKLAHSEFPVLVEIVPPKGPDPTREIEAAQYLAQHGADAVNIPDGSAGTARMSAQTLAVMLQQRAGIEPVLHYSCRGRNVLTIQSDLLGDYALGIRNILAITGNPPSIANYPATPVYDVDSIGLVNVLNNLNRGLDVGGNPLGMPTSFLIGVNLNPQAVNLDEEVRRFRYKVEAGADFAVTRPVFDVDRLAGVLARLDREGIRRIPVLAGISPLVSFRNAEFMNNEVPGVAIPAEILERMRKVETGDAARAEGVRIAQEILGSVRELVQGVQIAAPFGRVSLAMEVAEALGGRRVTASSV